MAKRMTHLGNIALTNLVHETRIVGGKKGIFIPIDDNPCLYFSEKNGTKTINLDIEVKPTPNNKYGSDFMVKASVGRENRKKYGITRETIDRFTPILGNLRTFEFEERQAPSGPAGGQAPAPYQGPDMPEEFDGSW